MFIAFNILRVVDNIILILLSTTLFCCGGIWRSDVNSPPLSVLSIFNLVRVSVSTFSLNCLKVSNA
ncbi:hypothetical protein Hanom_Chr12g01086591 [Helianthus anomalus]